ncbi:CCA tRNA nucleotidyltransferase [Limnochorda pilosa]|uniref:Polynucleotide adenylyltransferase n=1 Tax=Limnochorda pilosa TaxID=1555112 RepID=A0A0K2SQD6_LIMPI|nr:CCA tRNA nucleotidyltransferase [Limnochorda pilosa]BAS29044.1 polynucleotide adenylyltransferase [Limnochorda pilosa]
MTQPVQTIHVPAAVEAVCRHLAGAGFQVYLVGGCVRDSLLGRPPRDWDVATDARPPQVLDLFPEARPTGIAFGTVTVPLQGLDPGDGVEVTTFRIDLEYRDAHRPGRVAFADRLEPDLARRDFTINALAYEPLRGELVDLARGLDDLRRGVIRAVGDPFARLHEDPLRSLRAVRLVAELGFRIDPRTRQAARALAGRLPLLSGERIRDELLRLLVGPHAGRALREASWLGLLSAAIPELAPARAFPQGKPNARTLLEHVIQTVSACPPDPVVRLAALLHDVAKPQTAQRQWAPSGRERLTFYGHDVEGAVMAGDVCQRLKLDRRRREAVVSLVRWHMVSGSDLGKKAVRRWMAQAPRLEDEETGEAWVRRLIALRRADHLASGHGPENPFADRLEQMLAEVAAEASAFTVHDLAVDGHRVMELLGIGPGPEVGRALSWLLDRVLDDPSLNTPERLAGLIRELPPAHHGQG